MEKKCDTQYAWVATNYRMYLLSFPGEMQFYHIASLQPLGHNVTIAVLRDTIQNISLGGQERPGVGRKLTLMLNITYV